MRSGFTLVETLVALVIAAIAIIALAGTAALVASQTGEGAQLTRAAQRARSILDSLASRPCSEVVPGVDTTSALPAAWRVSVTSRTKIVEVELRTHTRRGAKAHALRSAFTCESAS